MVIALAFVAGLAIENARRFEWTRHTAVTDERERLAGHLHDTVIQSLFPTGYALQGMAEELGSGLVAADLLGAVSDIDDNIGIIRSTIYDLGLRGGEREPAPASSS